jgi:hypothetical protein
MFRMSGKAGDRAIEAAHERFPETNVVSWVDDAGTSDVSRQAQKLGTGEVFRKSMFVRDA